jgi:hypothetical protein
LIYKSHNVRLTIVEIRFVVLCVSRFCSGVVGEFTFLLSICFRSKAECPENFIAAHAPPHVHAAVPVWRPARRHTLLKVLWTLLSDRYEDRTGHSWDEGGFASLLARHSHYIFSKIEHCRRFDSFAIDFFSIDLPRFENPDSPVLPGGITG